MTLQVVKVGSSSIIRNGTIVSKTLDRLCYEVTEMYKGNVGSIMVVSGAIPLGMAKRGISKRPEDKMELQSLAREGQPELVRLYNDSFNRAGNLRGTQFLVTYHNLATPKERGNIVNGIKLDISKGLVPLINYNDGVDPEEAQKDNDRLAAEIAKYINAERLVILGIVNGVMRGEEVIPEIVEVTDEIRQLDKGAGENGTGGLVTKLQAADIVVPEGIKMYLGHVDAGIGALIKRKNGTYFRPKFKRFL